MLIFELFAINASGEVIPTRNQHTAGCSFYSSRFVKYRSKQIPKQVELTAEVKLLMFVIGDNNASSVKDIYLAMPL